MQKIKQFELTYELKIESLEDLWVLSEFIIPPKDIIFSKTQRKIKIGGENSQKQTTKLIFTQIKVKKVEFKEQSLRVQGEILNETEFTAVGQSHSLNFEVGDVIKIQKNKLLKFEKNMIKKAILTKKSLNLLILLDREDMIVCEFGSLSYKILFENKGLGSKKYTNEEINENEQKYNLIKDVLKQKYDTIICAGPGSYKESLANFIQEKEKLKVITFKYSDVNSVSIQKAISQINKNGLLSENEIAKNSESVRLLLKKINKKEAYAYGKKEVEEKTNLGSVSRLLVTTKFIKKSREDEKYSEVEAILLGAEKLNSTISILNSKHEPGRIVDGLGGIAAILRY